MMGGAIRKKVILRIVCVESPPCDTNISYSWQSCENYPVFTSQSFQRSLF